MIEVSWSHSYYFSLQHLPVSIYASARSVYDVLLSHRYHPVVRLMSSKLFELPFHPPHV